MLKNCDGQPISPRRITLFQHFRDGETVVNPIFKRCLRALVFPLIGACALPGLGATCESLSALKLPDTKITVAESVAEGEFTPPYGNAIDKVAAFCRVAGVIQPTSDSYIRFEVWLPVAGNWNAKFLGVGNGGFAGGIDYNAMGADVTHGYATAGTDTGHEADGVDASWAFHHPEKAVDFGYRAIHLTARNAKSLVKEFYERPADKAYFESCSNGGREALMEAQRFPEDYDGILAGAPANNWTHMLTSGLELSKAMLDNPSAYISDTKIPAIHAATLAACDAADGVKDGVISDPAGCHFDPSVLLCKGVESRACLTGPEVATLKRMYAGGQNYPGFTPGGEDGPGGWGTWVFGSGPGLSLGYGFTENYFRYMVFEDPSWNALTANVADAGRMAEQKTARFMNATDPNLQKFQARKGKLILYHGWNDPAISAWNTVNYYKSVVGAMGQRNTSEFVRLYMIPGMQHCGGGPGASSFGQSSAIGEKDPHRSVYAALEEWVEKGTAPEEIVANSGKEGSMTRPICAYPQIAKYRGSGDNREAASFVCGVAGE
jgi:hypothetical protein